MRLKDYQATVLDKLSSYLKLLSEQAAKARRHALLSLHCPKKHVPI